MYVSPNRYLDTVRRDLLWLLKTDASPPHEMILRKSSGSDSATKRDEFGNLPPAATLADYPAAATSCVAYGVPMSRGEIDLGTSGFELARTLERAIRAFEPRLDPRTLRIRVTPRAASKEQKDGESDLFVLGIEIQGRVRTKSVSQDLVLQAYYTPAFAQWRIEGVGNGP
jgi:predicted component of type VI protein secretion system